MGRSATQQETEFDMNSPVAVAVRVKMLEDTSREGFREMSKKLDKYIDGFVQKPQGTHRRPGETLGRHGDQGGHRLPDPHRLYHPGSARTLEI
jgi:hypothetical protein